VMRACHRVLEPGGRFAFFVIGAANDLSAAQRRRALEVGHLDAGPGYPALLDRAGFSAIDVVDVTEAYLATLASWYEAYEAEAAALEDLIGAEDFADRQTRRQRTLASIEDGVVRRFRVTARRPPTDQTE